MKPFLAAAMLAATYRAPMTKEEQEAERKWMREFDMEVTRLAIEVQRRREERRGNP